MREHCIDSKPIHKIIGAKIISDGWQSDRRYDILIDDATISNVTPHHDDPDLGPFDLDARGCLVSPSLCHAHVHLDKCFLLNDPKYADLEIAKGDFAEALELTSRAKERFDEDDLLRRGRWLIEESIAVGVTCMRTFVEVDVIVRHKCLDAAIKLKEEYKGACHIQICAFAQDPIFSSSTAGENRRLLSEALEHTDVEVLGTTPYVEDSKESQITNINWATEQAVLHRKHLDLHLDYNLDPSKQSFVADVLSNAAKVGWIASNAPKTIALGHCTRMTLFRDHDLKGLSETMKDFPLAFIGLPTSDLFMMARPSTSASDRVRGTLQIPHLIKKYNISCAISINNVGNAFTPYGSCDPLSVASMGVGIYQAGTKEDAKIMYECVSTRAKDAIGLGQGNQPFTVGMPADFVIFGSPGCTIERRRGRGSVQEIVYDPPKDRMTVYRGCLIEI